MWRKFMVDVELFDVMLENILCEADGDFLGRRV
jgi:hypothetical protein